MVCVANKTHSHGPAIFVEYVFAIAYVFGIVGFHDIPVGIHYRMRFEVLEDCRSGVGAAEGLYYRSGGVLLIYLDADTALERGALVHTKL